MIQGNHSTLQLASWQNQLAKSIKDPEQLLTALKLPQEHLPGMKIAHQMFPLRVTLSYLSRIKIGDITDPLLRQILPAPEESIKNEHYSQDPVGDKSAEVQPGLLHKYKNRVLLTLTAACGIHCRYCFRRHFDYSASNASKFWQKSLSYIKNHSEIKEVIFSGGDPLSLSDQRLATMVKDLSLISHVNTLRIHTRQIIVLPDRVDNALLNWIKNTRLKIVMVVHINHANEMDEDVEKSLKLLHNLGVTLLNQSVLLKGVNDCVETLCELSQTLFLNNVLPYYIHLLDKVEGATHFDVNEKNAVNLLNKLRAELPGYLVPKLVKEVANESSKIPVL